MQQPITTEQNTAWTINGKCYGQVVNKVLKAFKIKEIGEIALPVDTERLERIVEWARGVSVSVGSVRGDAVSEESTRGDSMSEERAGGDVVSDESARRDAVSEGSAIGNAVSVPVGNERVLFDEEWNEFLNTKIVEITDIWGCGDVMLVMNKIVICPERTGIIHKKESGKVGSLVVLLPSGVERYDISVLSDRKAALFSFSKEMNPDSVTLFALTGESEHEILSAHSGYRIAIVYSLLSVSSVGTEETSNVTPTPSPKETDEITGSTTEENNKITETEASPSNEIPASLPSEINYNEISEITEEETNITETEPSTTIETTESPARISPGAEMTEITHEEINTTEPSTTIETTESPAIISPGATIKTPTFPSDNPTDNEPTTIPTLVDNDGKVLKRKKSSPE